MNKIKYYIRFIPPLLIFILTMVLIFFCINHGFMGLFYAEWYITGTLAWFLFSIIFVLWIMAFYTIMWDDPGSMKLEMRANQNNNHNCHILCPKCGMTKPFRTHHCSICNCCFACMDHHCTVVGRCIALRNRKVFIQYLCYSILMLLIYALCCFVSIFINEFTSFPIFLVLNCFVGASLALFLGILLYQQISTMLKGRTIMEELCEIRFTDGLTKYQRFQEVFGPPSLDWIIPRPLPFKYVNAFQWEKYRTIESKKSE
ncbi:DHHC zinc finger domain containing protein [Tritrichomonas foetus]|uniref:Palmitoyltransferase n=1 Tax=Tritrichomonas foetus TaxID=1144522 RepID=A0A1J4JRW3_9EUKA|nr:DHHC zinc finger domain containing protein [Tritrichomonas foetus]|eukprot:OHT01879.1 DHHC zinc finger domain containing protein [Tritrichomonas foetus]